jgi:hypothetical protein
LLRPVILLHSPLITTTASSGGLSCISDVVIQTLCYEDQVREAEVYGECDDSRDQPSPQCASEIGDITDEPDGEEGEGDTVSGRLAIVL